MKKIILGAGFLVATVAALPAIAANATICNALTSAASGTKVTGGNNFVKVDFTPKCSANVFLVGNDQSPIVYTVGSASKKGKSYFEGSSAGGSVRRVDDCATANDCKLSDAELGATKAPST